MFFNLEIKASDVIATFALVVSLSSLWQSSAYRKYDKQLKTAEKKTYVLLRFLNAAAKGRHYIEKLEIIYKVANTNNNVLQLKKIQSLMERMARVSGKMEDSFRRLEKSDSKDAIALESILPSVEEIGTEIEELLRSADYLCKDCSGCDASA